MKNRAADPSARRVLLLGAGGQLGRALWEFRPSGVEVVRSARDDLDLTRPVDIEAALKAASPDLILNAAAYTAVDRAEREFELACAVNAEAPAALARLARAGGIRLVHVSTDFVFPGDRGRPWRPEDPPRPVNRYGESKAEGEKAIQSLGHSLALIVRTGWVYAPWGHNFFRTILRLLGERDELHVIDDQVGTPTSALSLARFLWKVAMREDLSGILHWSDAGVASWYDFACAIEEEARNAGLLKRLVPIHPIPTEAYPLPARRPFQAILDKSETIARTGLEPVHWRTALSQVVRRFAEDPNRPGSRTGKS